MSGVQNNLEIVFSNNGSSAATILFTFSLDPSVDTTALKSEPVEEVEPAFIDDGQRFDIFFSGLLLQN